MKRVLIIDDHPDLRRLVRWSLEMLDDDIEVAEATDGARGLALAGELHPDLVMLDVMMPGEINGLEVCRRIRAMPALQRTPVVLLSALGETSDVRAGLAAGATSYMVKPFSPQRLLQAAEQLLRA